MPAEFSVVDLSRNDFGRGPALLQASEIGQVDLDALRDQLVEIRDSIGQVIDSSCEAGALHLSTIELDLTVGLEGKVWFIAKGSAEASLKLTWSR
jgi:hypothetical protein